VGIVEEIGSEVTKLKVGDRVTINVETFCNDCFYCKRRYVNNCVDPNGGWALGCRMDGCQAEYVRVQYADNCLNLIPDNVSDRQALFTGDILSTGYWAADVSRIEEGDVVAIIGAGPTGLCSAICARLHNPSKIVLIDVIQSRLDFAMEHGIGDMYLNPDEVDVKECIRNINGRGADVVMEVAGGEDTFQTAWRIARPNATVCIVALYNEPQSIPLPDMYGKNLTFVTGGVDASRCDEILGHISAGRIDIEPLITHTFPLDEWEKGYELFSSKGDGVIKVALKP
jgi:alcohol dehydrogenase